MSVTAEPMPTDVIVARAVKAHTQTLLAVIAAPLLLAGVGAAALAMAGDAGQDPPAVAGASMVVMGQVLAIVTAVFVGRNLARLLSKAGTPGSAESEQSARRGEPIRIMKSTMDSMLMMVKVIGVAAVIGIAAWAIIDTSGLVGAIVGAILIAQVAVVIALSRVAILHRTMRSLPAPQN